MHPVAFAAAYVLALFAASPAHVVVLWRPLTVAVTIALVAQVALTLLLRSAARGAVAATCIVLALAGLWPFAVLILVLAGWGFARRRFVATADRSLAFLDAAHVSRGLNVMGGVALLVAMAVTVSSDLDRWVEAAASPSGPSIADGRDGPVPPDIYIIWLDGYPSAVTLQDEFGIDNSAFLTELTARGFEVADESRSNYALTWLTMSSMFHMKYVHSIPELVPPDPNPNGQFKQLRRAVNAAPAMDYLRSRGYTLVSSQGAFTEAGFRAADIVLDDGQLNQLEEQMMRLSALAGIVDAISPDWFGHQARTRITASFDHLTAMAERQSSGGPIAMVAQVMAPHTPFVWHADGTPRQAPECHPRSCFLWETEVDDLGLTQQQYASGLAEHLAFTNESVLRTVDRIVDARPDAIVIVMSDHGTRYRTNQLDELFENLFAARTPHREDVFPETISPVNLFPHLFAAYFDETAVPMPYEAWYTTTPKPLDLVRYR